MGDIKENPCWKTKVKCSCKKSIYENGDTSPPFLDDLVKWDNDFDGSENTSFFWLVILIFV